MLKSFSYSPQGDNMTNQIINNIGENGETSMTQYLGFSRNNYVHTLWHIEASYLVYAANKLGYY